MDQGTTSQWDSGLHWDEGDVVHEVGKDIDGDGDINPDEIFHDSEYEDNDDFMFDTNIEVLPTAQSQNQRVETFNWTDDEADSEGRGRSIGSSDDEEGNSRCKGLKILN